MATGLLIQKASSFLTRVASLGDHLDVLYGSNLERKKNGPAVVALNKGNDVIMSTNRKFREKLAALGRGRVWKDCAAPIKFVNTQC